MEQYPCTSLQDIMAENNKEMRMQQLTQLFRANNHQPFSLPSIDAASGLHQHSLYQYFASALQQWNDRTHQSPLPLFSETEYQRYRFIHDRLKFAAAHSLDSADRILRQLQEWHSGFKQESVKYSPKEQRDNVGDEEWLLRKTFKSSLPSEIGNYRRKNCKLPQEEGKENKVRLSQNGVSLAPLERWRKVKTEACYDAEFMDEVLSSRRLLMLKNNRMRTEREKGEFSSLQREWKVKKSRMEELGIKSYYEGDFPKDKKMAWPKLRGKVRKNRDQDGFGGIKAASSFNLTSGRSTPSNDSSKNRPFKRGINASTPVLILPSTGRLISGKASPSSTPENSLGLQMQAIDGLSLMTNPFQTSMKKKRRPS